MAECVAAGDRDGVDRGFHAYETNELVRERRQWLAMESMSVLGRWHSDLVAPCSTYEVDVDWESSLSSGSDGEAGEDSLLTLFVRSSSDASGVQTMAGEADGVAKVSGESSAISSDRTGASSGAPWASWLLDMFCSGSSRVYMSRARSIERGIEVLALSGDACGG